MVALRLTARDRDTLGETARRSTNARETRRALALLPSLGVDSLITARFPLDRIAEGFAHAAAGRGVKTVVTPAGV